MQRYKTSRRQQGAMLIDLLLALFVGMVVAIAVCNLMVAATGVGALARENDVATLATRQIIENVRQFKGAVVTNNTYTGTDFGPVPQLSQLPAGVVSSVSIATYRGSLKQVTATVTWRGASTNTMGVLRRRVLTALVAPRGITK